jgi:hypothetical protein
MTAADVLKTTRAAGVKVNIDGDDLILEASAMPPQAMLEALSRQKAEILMLLRREAKDWSTDDWMAFFHERTGIGLFDGELGRLDAELGAFEDCTIHWLAMHPPNTSPDGLCLYCKLPLSPDETTNVQIAGGQAGQVGLLHPRCAPKWMSSRRWEARRALGWLLEVWAPEQRGELN